MADFLYYVYAVVPTTAAVRPAPAGVDLGFNHDHLFAFTEQLFRDDFGLFGRAANIAWRNGDAARSEQLLGLEFVEIQSGLVVR